jgi:hypothetical protein
MGAMPHLVVLLADLEVVMVVVAEVIKLRLVEVMAVAEQ